MGERKWDNVYREAAIMISFDPSTSPKNVICTL